MLVKIFGLVIFHPLGLQLDLLHTSGTQMIFPYCHFVLPIIHALLVELIMDIGN